MTKEKKELIRNIGVVLLAIVATIVILVSLTRDAQEESRISEGVEWVKEK